MSQYSKTILDHRGSLRDAFRENAAAKDKIVVSVAGAALALSLSIFRDVATDERWKWLLVTAWVLLALSLISVLVSLFLNAGQIIRSVRRIDTWLRDVAPEGCPEDGGYSFTVQGRSVRTVDLIEGVSVFALVVGVGAVVLFASLTI